MTYFNLIKESIYVNQVDFITAVNKNVEFSITYKGDIVYAPVNEPLIFKGRAQRPNGISTAPLPITQTLGKYYTITLSGPKLEIKASSNWQDIIGFNIDHAHYDDTTGDGISQFGDKALEDMGWYAADFNINYREMVEHLEAHVEGIIFCIERDEPYQFSGFGFFADLENTRKVLKAFIIEKIEDKLKNDPDFSPENLDDDEEEALEFFGLR